MRLRNVQRLCFRTTLGFKAQVYTLRVVEGGGRLAHVVVEATRQLCNMCMDP